MVVDVTERSELVKKLRTFIGTASYYLFENAATLQLNIRFHALKRGMSFVIKALVAWLGKMRVRQLSELHGGIGPCKGRVLLGTP